MFALEVGQINEQGETMTMTAREGFQVGSSWFYDWGKTSLCGSIRAVSQAIGLPEAPAEDSDSIEPSLIGPSLKEQCRDS